MNFSSWPRIILHSDLNAFFASVEQVSNPSLRGKPVAVVGAGHRTVITTCSYEARAKGVRTGMNLYEGRGKCPELITVTANNAKYIHISTEIIDIYRSFTPQVEVFSIDEAWLDVTGCMKLFGSPVKIAEKIKQEVFERFGLTLNIGISYNKLLAKLAGDIGPKPNGTMIIAPQDTSRVLRKLPVDEICGIGSKAAIRMAKMSIHTCGELAKYDTYLLKQAFGVNGLKFQNMAKGLDETPVVPGEEAEDVKSVGHSMTLDHDISSRVDIEKYLLRLAEMVGRRLRKHNTTGKTVAITVRFSDFSTTQRQTTIKNYINLTEEIFETAKTILDRTTITQSVRLLGINVGNLRHEGEGRQLPLLENELKKNQLTEAMDAMNNKHGSGAVTFGTILDERGGNKVISPAWRDKGIRNPKID